MPPKKKSVVTDQGEKIIVRIDGVDYERYKCTIPDELGRACGSIIHKYPDNKKTPKKKQKRLNHSIASHRRIHDPNSKYNLEKKRFVKPKRCLERDCFIELASKSAIDSHHRSKHGYKGAKAKLFSRYGVSGESRISHETPPMILITDNGSI